MARLLELPRFPPSLRRGPWAPGRTAATVHGQRFQLPALKIIHGHRAGGTGRRAVLRQTHCPRAGTRWVAASCPTTEWREPSLWLGTEAAQPAAEDRMVRRVSWSWHRAWRSLSAPGVSNCCRCRYEFIFSTVQWKNRRAAACASEPHVVPGTRDKGRGASSSPGHHGLTQNRFLGERLLRGPSSRWPRGGHACGRREACHHAYEVTRPRDGL